MPCRDYRDDEDRASNRSQRDMLARIACKAMYELERQGVADFLLLQDDEVREWWTQHKLDDAAAMSTEKAMNERGHK